MIPLRIERATRRVGESQGYHGLSIRDEVVNNVNLMLSSWEPDANDMKYLRKGNSSFYVLVPMQDGYVILKEQAITREEQQALLHGGSVIMIVSGVMHPAVWFCIAKSENMEDVPRVNLGISVGFSVRAPAHV